MKITDELNKKYWHGRWNKTVRYYFYVQSGLSLLNEFRYLVMSILAIYAILKLEDWWIMPMMFFGAVPILGLLGWLNVHRMEKIIEYLRVKYSTHYNHYNIELQEKQLNILEDINNHLKINANNK